MNKHDTLKNQLLVLRCQEGDGKAFAELVLCWHQRLLRYAHRLTGNHDGVEEIVQDVWLAVTRSIHSIDDPDTFPKWIFQITTFKCRDWIRKQQSRRGFLQRFLREKQRERQPTAQPTEKLTRLAKAMVKLTHEQRALIALHYEEGFTITELAQMLRIKPGTVKSRLHTARNHIRQSMEAPNHE